ncbi:tetratricopeptide repeat protein [Vulgatibacter incomptus]|uniref:Uncharacterized protein n=1 Tax=Vulgatibacter incomptus TaxID=1391653 RepID=A0A0K1P9V0_9BACT|nr:tetratricopeptide repeat protein [Vulgatibacter incomptus]AKU90308.1 hypothetical protein AKJ08_0695 [Vulgatibacter incomptus]
MAAALLLAALSACPGADTAGDMPAERLAAEGLALARGGQIPAALGRFDEALRLDPGNRKALYNGGLAHLALSQGAEAKGLFERFLAVAPNDAEGHVALAHAQEHLGEAEAAMASLRRAVELGLTDPELLTGGGFESIQGDVRFVQLVALVAQRSGVRAPLDDRGRLLVGGHPLRTLRLAGEVPRETCDAPGPEGGPDVGFPPAAGEAGR